MIAGIIVALLIGFAFGFRLGRRRGGSIEVTGHIPITPCSGCGAAIVGDFDDHKCDYGIGEDNG